MNYLCIDIKQVYSTLDSVATTCDRFLSTSLDMSFYMLCFSILGLTYALPSRVVASPHCTPLLPSSNLPDPPPGSTLKLIALGIGTQNYTCKDSVPTGNGAIASLLDITSLQHTQECAHVSTRGTMKTGEIGRHYFARDSVPTFDVTKSRPPFTFFGTKSVSVTAPGSPPITDVDWLMLAPNLTLPNNGGIKAAYRVKTKGGVPVTPCSGTQMVPYRAEYWFFG